MVLLLQCSIAAAAVTPSISSSSWVIGIVNILCWPLISIEQLFS